MSKRLKYNTSGLFTGFNDQNELISDASIYSTIVDDIFYEEATLILLRHPLWGKG